VRVKSLQLHANQPNIVVKYAVDDVNRTIVGVQTSIHYDIESFDTEIDAKKIHARVKDSTGNMIAQVSQIGLYIIQGITQTLFI